MKEDLLPIMGEDRMILISDSMRATGMPDGQYTLGARSASFSIIPAPCCRYYSAEEHDFWQMIVSLILAGYRVQ